MGKSIPQLQFDIGELQIKLTAAEAYIQELESRPPVVVREKVPFEVVRVEYRDKEVTTPVSAVTADIAAKDAEIARLADELAAVTLQLMAAQRGRDIGNGGDKIKPDDTKSKDAAINRLTEELDAARIELIALRRMRKKVLDIVEEVKPEFMTTSQLFDISKRLLSLARKK